MDPALAALVGAYMLVFGLLGGWVAMKKGDYFSRGLVMSLFSGFMGPLFLYFSPHSTARQPGGDEEKPWHTNGVFPAIIHTVLVLVVYFAVV